MIRIHFLRLCGILAFSLTLLLIFGGCGLVDKITGSGTDTQDISWETNNPRTLNYVYTCRYDFGESVPKTETKQITLQFTGNKKVDITVDGKLIGKFTMEKSGHLTPISTEAIAPVMLDGLTVFPEPSKDSVKTDDTWTRLDPSEDVVALSQNSVIVQTKREYKVSSLGSDTNVEVKGSLRTLDTPGARKFLKTVISGDVATFISGLAYVQNYCLYLTAKIDIDTKQHAVKRYNSSSVLDVIPGITTDQISTSPDRYEASLELQ
jgi:hypothetical protein